MEEVNCPFCGRSFKIEIVPVKSQNEDYAKSLENWNEEYLNALKKREGDK